MKGQELNLGYRPLNHNHSQNRLIFNTFGQQGPLVVFDDLAELWCSVFSLHSEGSGFHLFVSFSVYSSSSSSVPSAVIDLWHCRLGHSNNRDVQKLSYLVTVHFLHYSSFSGYLCDNCAETRITRKISSGGVALQKSSESKWDCFDDIGSMRITTFGRQRYAESFIDTFVALMMNTSRKKMVELRESFFLSFF